jgi:hypothetical protein
MFAEFKLPSLTTQETIAMDAREQAVLKVALFTFVFTYEIRPNEIELITRSIQYEISSSPLLKKMVDTERHPKETVKLNKSDITT